MTGLIEQGKKVLGRFGEAEGMSMAAALAFYTLFAMPPLLFVLVNIVSFTMATYYEGDVAADKAQKLLRNQVAQLVGNANAGEEVGRIIEQTSLQGGTWWRISISLIAVLVGATGLVHALQSSLNRIWGVRVQAGVFSLRYLWKRFYSLGMLLAFGILLVVSFIISTLINFAGDQLSEFLGAPGMVPVVANFIANVVVSWLFFTLVFRVMPDANVSWKAAIWGGTLTLLLFMIGRWGLTIYLNTSQPGKELGSATAALVILILWVYYSSAILLLGASYTYCRENKPAVPQDGAESTEAESKHKSH
jgi:membrane protein